MKTDSSLYSYLFMKKKIFLNIRISTFPTDIRVKLEIEPKTYVRNKW